MTSPQPVTLFVQCLVDALAPEVGGAMLRVLRRLGVAVSCQHRHTCCGQPAFNAGYHHEARRAAKLFLRRFSDAGHIVCPSGSCVHMVRRHYPELLAAEPAWAERARQVAARTFEFSQYLVDVLGVEDVGARWPGRVTYHDSCHLLRGLRVFEQPRRLLAHVAGLELVEMHDSDYCCGFGGAFAVKYPDISAAMVSEKVEKILATGAGTVVGCDTGCLLNIQGRLSRLGAGVRVVHLAQVLANR